MADRGKLTIFDWRLFNEEWSAFSAREPGLLNLISRWWTILVQLGAILDESESRKQFLSFNWAQDHLIAPLSHRISSNSSNKTSLRTYRFLNRVPRFLSRGISRTKKCTCCRDGTRVLNVTCRRGFDGWQQTTANQALWLAIAIDVCFFKKQLFCTCRENFE